MLDFSGIGERTERVAELEQECLPHLAFAQGLLGAVGSHLGRSVYRDVQQAGDRARFIPDGRIGEVPPSILRIPVPGHDQRHVLESYCFASEDARYERFDLLPDVGPRFTERQAERCRAPGAEHRSVGVIIENNAFRSPGKLHRVARAQHDIDGGLQALRPTLKWPKGSTGPIMRTDAVRHLVAVRPF